VVPTLVHDGKPVSRWLAGAIAELARKALASVAKQQGEYIARLLIKQAQGEI
jgi:NADH dehydrogenase FAD-containing subunit